MVSMVPPWHSLKTRITFTTLGIFLAGIWSLSFYASHMLRQDMEHLLGEQQNSAVSMVTDQVNRELGERLRALEAVAALSSQAMREGPAAIQTFIGQRPDLHALFNLGVFVTGIDGITIADFPLKAGRIGINYIDRDYVATTVKNGKSTIGRPIIGKATRAPALAIAAPIRDALGQVIGVLVGATSLGVPNFLDQITESRYGKTGGFLLVAPQHRVVVTASDKRRIMETLPAPGASRAIDNLIGGHDWSTVTTTLHGMEVLASSRSIPVAGWQAIAALPTAEAFTPISDMQQRILITTLFLTLLAGCLSWWMLRRQLLPLVDAAKTLAAMSGTSQRLQALAVARQDEIGQLIGSFNRLLGALRERETALQESEARFRALHDASFGGIAIHDEGTILDCNQGLSELTGFTTEELVGMNGLRLVAPEDRKRVLQNIQRGFEQPYDIEGFLKDGTRRDFSIRGKNMPYKGRTVQVTEFRDITERKQAEAKLVESEARLQTLIHAIPDLIWLKNPEGVYLACNQRFERFFGKAEKDIVGKTDYDFVDKELADFFREHDRIAMANGAPSVNEEWINFADDGHRELLETTKTPVRDVHDHLVGVLGIGHDITERRLAEQNQRIAAIAFESQEGMFITDAVKVIVRVNHAFSRITGYSAEEAVGQTPDLLHSGRHDTAFYDGMMQSIRTDGAWQGEVWNRRKDGQIYPQWLTVTAVRDGAGEITNYVAALTDITERKHLESEMEKRIEELNALNKRLEETQTQLVQAEKMSAVGQLAAGIAHEINNPVGFVNSNLGTLKYYVADLLRLIDAYRLLAQACPQENLALSRVNALCGEIDIDFLRNDVKSLLGESLDGLERVKRIVADLKDFSRIGESKWQPADVHKCLDSTLNVVTNEIKYKASVVKEYGLLPDILCMPFQLNQVFMNLLVNAAHAIPEQGTITLRTGCEAETVWIEVEDDGVGIPEENLQRIFEPFFTTKPIGSGTGLGLSVSYGIVQKHQGQIEVRSEPGRGTVFRVTLPINQLPESEPEDLA